MQNITPCCVFDDLYSGMALTPDEAAAFQDFIQHEVTPFVASHLPLDGTGLALLGASLGAIVALCAMLRRPTRQPPTGNED